MHGSTQAGRCAVAAAHVHRQPLDLAVGPAPRTALRARVRVIHPLTVGTQLRVFPDHLRSVSTGQPLGAAQGRPWSIASGVRRSRRARAIRSRCRSSSKHRISCGSRSACVLKARDLAEVNKATRAGDFDRFVELVARLRGRSPTDAVRGVTRDLFDVPPIETAPPYVAPTHAARLRNRPAAEHPRDLTGDLFDLSPGEAAAFAGACIPVSGARDETRDADRARICCNLAIAGGERRATIGTKRCAATDASMILDGSWFTPPTCAPRTLSVGVLHTATLREKCRCRPTSVRGKPGPRSVVEATRSVDQAFRAVRNESDDDVSRANTHLRCRASIVRSTSWRVRRNFSDRVVSADTAHDN